MSEQDYSLVSDPKRYEEVVASLLKADVYAVDTEFVRERTYFPILAVVQVAWPGGLALLDSMRLDMTKLRPVFEGPGLALVHAGSQDIPILRTAAGAPPARIYDTQVAGTFLGHGIASLGNLIEKELGHRVEKGSQLTDWTRRPLDAKALRYAASDVEHLHTLYDVTRRGLEERGRLQWALEECEALRLKDLSERSPDEAWWRLKGKSKLRGKARGVAQALGRFRLEEAASRDIPVKRVLSDMAILGMAGRPPRNEKDLERIRGMGSLGHQFASRLLDAVQRGAELPDESLHLPPLRPKGDDSKAAVTLCSSWVNQLAQDHDIEPGMLATRDDVHQRMAGQPSRLDTGWRHALTADSIDALNKGRAALGVRQGRLVLVDIPV